MSTNPLNNISRVYLENVFESAVPGKPAERLGAVTAIPKSEQEAARERTLAKAKAKRGAIGNKSLDPVGKEDGDIDNDGDADKTDKYLLNRRKAIGDAIKKEKMRESFSNWREELSEIMSVIDKQEKEQKIVEKEVDNKIAINPNLGESIEELGGTLIEMVEIDEVDYIVESVYDELLCEGYVEEDIEEALEYALTEAKVTFGHDTPTGEKKRTNLIGALGRLARQKLSSKVRDVKKSAKAAVARGARKVAKGALNVARKAEGSDKTPSAAHTKTRSASTYRGAGAGQKEKVSSGSYQAPTKKKVEKPSDPWEGSATTPPKKEAKPAAKKPAAKPKATTKTTKVTPKPEAKPAAKAQAAKAAPQAAAKPKPKAKKKSKLDSLLADIRSESVMGGPVIKPNSGLGGGKPVYQKGQEPKPTGAKLPTLQKAHYEPSGDQLDEKTLSKKETKEKERIVKSMKDKAADFEKRYPGRGKEVMYATATKLAKKIAK